MNISELIDSLEQIAKDNGDEFGYRVDITKPRSGLRFEFEAYEAADHNTFLTGAGGTLEAAVDRAAMDIEGAKNAWGYK